MREHHSLRGAVVAVSLSFVVACGAPAGGDPLVELPRDPEETGELPRGVRPGDVSDDEDNDEDDEPRTGRGGGIRAGTGGTDHRGQDEDHSDDDTDDGEGSDAGSDGDDVGGEEPADPVLPDPSDPGDPTDPPAPPPVPVDPTAPLASDGTELPWPAAPHMSGVVVKKNRDSVLLSLPVVAGAVDYRAFILTDDVTLEVGDGDEERVVGATVHCAGHEQRNAPDTGVRVPLRTLEVTGVRGPVRIVVEALDRACPFVGVIGRDHVDIDVTNYALTASDKISFSIFTEEEVRDSYGSLIVNGHRKGSPLGAPASDAPPGVLARTTVQTAPSAEAAPVSDFFSGFANDDDQPVYVGTLPAHGRVPYPGELRENSQFTFTTYAQEHTQVFLDRGQLHMLLADWSQDVFGTAVAYPKRAAVMSDDAYVHVTFEVASNSTQRRYWWLSLCGAGAPGQTLDENGRLKGNIIQTPFFYQNDGKNPSIEKWSCLQLFPRDGLPDALAPTGTRPESDLRVMVNVANAGDRESVRNVSPAQYPNGYSAPSWYRQMDANGGLVAPILDDQIRIAPKTRYDVYVRGDRVIVYVNGEQRLCNDFPSTPLTMAEAAVGFGMALYHSAAERVEFSRDFNDRTGQRYYLENTPYLDARAWDNVGFDDGVAAPSSFDDALCYVHGG